MAKLRAEIRQSKPFSSLQEEVVLSLWRTADQVALPMEEVLKEAGLSFSQYNILRILRGSPGDGLTCSDIADRMIARDPDVTRLLDRLETRGLVARARSTTDRRVVLTSITHDGLGALDALDAPMEATVKKSLAHMPKARLQMLLELLEEARDARS